MELRAERICKAYGGVPVLQNVTFTAGPGVTCLMGPSGRGKTTLLRILMGLEQADSGRVVLPAGCRWGAVFQEDRLLERLDARENLRFVLGGAYREDAASGLLEQLGLGDVGAKPAGAFSGGMKRRLALARALLAPADLLALDEPLTGLDEGARAASVACIRRWGAGKTVLLVTHMPSDAEALDAAVVQLDDAAPER